MNPQENTEQQLMKKLLELMKKNGTQLKQLKVGSEVLKISLLDQPKPFHQILPNYSAQSSHSINSIQKTRSNQSNHNIDQSSSKKQIKFQSLKKLTLFCAPQIQQQQIQIPNSHVRDLFDDDDYFIKQQQQQLSYVDQHISFLLNNHPQSKDHIQAVLHKLEEVQKQNKQIKKKQLQISNIISESLSHSQSFFQSSSTFLSVIDPLCKLVSAHLKNLNDTSLVKNTETPSLLFLYSQPLIMYSAEAKKVPIHMQIDYEKEEQNIKKVLKDCKIGYIRECATVDKLGNWLQSGIQLIHFCGHGVKNQSNANKNDYLIFQDNQGGALPLSSQRITKILQKLKKPLQFVFVASCHSKSIGQVFLNAGSPHVICVRSEQKILDEACKQFVKQFYISCLNDGKTICESFQYAKFHVSLMNFPKGQQNKFIILKDQSMYQQHICTTLSSVKYGQFKDLSFKPTYSKNIPSKVQNFIIRHQIMHQIIQSLKMHRFITIKGIPGIGKSTLVRQLCRFLNYRSYFKDGILYNQISGCQSIQNIFHNINYEIFEGRYIKNTKGNFDQNMQKVTKVLSDKNILIILDNCDSILSSNDKSKFKQFIQTMLRQCHHLHFIFTNRVRIGQIIYNYQLDHCAERVFNLQKLDLEDSKNLFMSKSPRILQSEEIQEFMKMQKVIDLKKHPLFQFLNGHPQAISLSAALLESKSLKEVYELLVKQSIVKQQNLGDQKRGYNPFRISLQVSWNIIKKNHKEAALMFRIMGLLPAGLDSDTMPRVFGSSWRQSIKILQKYSLMKESQRLTLTYYTIHPFMLTFAESLIEIEQKKKYHQKIVQQLTKRLFDKIYKNIGTLSNSAEKSIELYLVEQINYKICIYRQYAFLGQTNKIKGFYSNVFNKDPQIYSQDQNSQNQRTQKKSNTDQNSLISSCSSTSKFFAQTAPKKTKIQQIHSQNQDYKVQQRKKLLRSKQKSPHNNQRQSFKSGSKLKKDPPSILRLILYQTTILFVMKNFSSCQKIISYGKQLSQKYKSNLSLANLTRIQGCIALFKKQQSKARDYFSKALELFAYAGCGLGTASCESAIGYIRFMQQQYAQAKKNLQSALKYYQQIPHMFGKHYLNRWLYNIKSKINRAQNQLYIHNEQAKKLIKQAKIALKGNKIDHFLFKHKAGVFVFRFMFDNISLFLQCAFQLDVKPKRIQQVTKQSNILKNLSLVQIPKKQQTLQNDLLTIIQDIQQKSFIGELQEQKIRKIDNPRNFVPKKLVHHIQRKDKKSPLMKVFKQSKQSLWIPTMISKQSAIAQKPMTKSISNSSLITRSQAPKKRP